MAFSIYFMKVLLLKTQLMETWIFQVETKINHHWMFFVLCNTLVPDLFTLHCTRKSNSLVNTLGKEWYVPGAIRICVFAVEDGGKNWNRLGEKPVFPERIKNHLILDHEISLQTRRAFQLWNHTWLQKLAWITANNLGVRHISETLSQTKCILFMEEEQEGKKIRWSGFNTW